MKRARSQGGLGDKSPYFDEKFFNLLGFLRKKHENPPPNFFHTKIFEIPPLENFWLRRWNEVLSWIFTESPFNSFKHSVD